MTLVETRYELAKVHLFLISTQTKPGLSSQYFSHHNILHDVLIPVLLKPHTVLCLPLGEVWYPVKFLIYLEFFISEYKDMVE